MSDCTNGGRRAYNAPTHSPAEDELRVIAHFKDGLPPKEFVANRDTLDGLRVLDYLEHDGERYERVRECEMEHVKSGALYDVWRCSACGYEYAESVSETSIVQNFCPNCGAKVKEVDA